MDINKIIEGLGEKKEEIIRKAALCKNAEELMLLAKESGVAIDKAGAAELFASMQKKAEKLSDDELDAVAGGGGILIKYRCRDCGRVFYGPSGARCINCRSSNLGPG